MNFLPPLSISLLLLLTLSLSLSLVLQYMATYMELNMLWWLHSVYVSTKCIRTDMPCSGARGSRFLVYALSIWKTWFEVQNFLCEYV